MTRKSLVAFWHYGKKETIVFEYKLQLACLVVVAYYIVIYTKETTGEFKIKCNRLFDTILAISPWAIIFDGATAWTVNHMDVVPDAVNRILHLLFFICEDVLIILVFVYMLSMTVGERYRKLRKLLLIPDVLSVIMIVCFIGQLYYIQGERTWYSMGISVIVCYLSLVVHFVFLAILVIRNHRNIEARKRVSVYTSVAASLILLAIQIVFPEALLSAMLPVINLICLYENFENPYLQRLRHYNEEMVTGFATLVENRDDSTGGHIKRTREYVKIIIEEMKRTPKYDKHLTKDYVRDVVNAAPMHDIGKISTPDNILQKPGRLEPEEYEIMKQHAAKGGEIIKKTFADINDEEYLKITYEVARYHHEKWNGKGYPEGLSGEGIPLHARIMAIADVFDAVSAKRCYRDAMPLDKCFEIIENGVGTDFDPELAQLFLNARDKVIKCYERTK